MEESAWCWLWRMEDREAGSVLGLKEWREQRGGRTCRWVGAVWTPFSRALVRSRVKTLCINKQEAWNNTLTHKKEEYTPPAFHIASSFLRKRPTRYVNYSGSLHLEKQVIYQTRAVGVTNAIPRLTSPIGIPTTPRCRPATCTRSRRHQPVQARSC